MSERYFSSQPITSDHITLDGPEAHHLLHVMCAAAGDPVTLFDGSGAEFQAHVETLRRTEVGLKIVERREISRELSFPLAVGVALPRGDRQKWLVEKLTELGVTTLVPLITERGVAQPNTNAVERLGRAVIEAAKQCGRNRLMEIAKPQAWDEWILSDFGFRISDFGFRIIGAIRNPQFAIDYRRFVAHPGGSSLREIGPSQPGPTQLAIGPEGGFTDAEVEAAATAGWEKISLGPRILRVETAAVALAALFSFTVGESDEPAHSKAAR